MFSFNTTKNISKHTEHDEEYNLVIGFNFVNYYLFTYSLPFLPYSTLTNTTTNVFSVGQGSSGDDDRDRDRDNRRYRPLPDRAYVDPALAKNNQKEDDEQETEEKDPNVKVVWLYPLDKDGNLIIPDEEKTEEQEGSVPDNSFESRSNTLFSPDSRRIFFSSPPNNPTGDSVWGTVTDTVTWHSLPLQDIPTVSTYDLETSFNSLNVSASSVATNSVEPRPSTSAMQVEPTSRPWRSRSFNPYPTPVTPSYLTTTTTTSATVATASTTGPNRSTGRYIIPQRRVHFQTSNTTTSEVVYNSGTRIELPPSEPRRSREPESNIRVSTPQPSTSGDYVSNRRETPQTIFFSDTTSTSSDSDTITANVQPRNVNSAVGTPLRRMQISDAVDIPSGSTHAYTDYTDDVWEPLPPIRDSSTLDDPFDYSQFPPPPVTESVPGNIDLFWDGNHSDQIDQTESNDTDAFAEVSSMLNQSFEDSRVHFNRRQNQHDIAPRVKDDRLVIPLFRLDQDGNLIYDWEEDSIDSSDSSDDSSSTSSIKFFAPMEYNFDPVYSPFPSASSSSLSSDEQGNDRPTSDTHGPFGIFPPRKPKKYSGSFGAVLQSAPQTVANPIPVVQSTNRVQSLFSMAGSEMNRASRTTTRVSSIASTTSRGSYTGRGRSASGSSVSHGRCRALRSTQNASNFPLHGEESTSSQATNSGPSQSSTSSSEESVVDLQGHECPRRRVQFTDPLVIPPSSSHVVDEQQPEQQQQPPQEHESESTQPQIETQELVSNLDDSSLPDLPSVQDSDSSDDMVQPQASLIQSTHSVPILSNIFHSSFSSDDSSID